jgi:hypothetical protein
MQIEEKIIWRFPLGCGDDLYCVEESSDEIRKYVFVTACIKKKDIGNVLIISARDKYICQDFIAYIGNERDFADWPSSGEFTKLRKDGWVKLFKTKIEAEEFLKENKDAG